MSLMSDASSVLYLHGGPGMSAELERRQFGTALPVLWWDQPRVSADAAEPFRVLVDAAANQVATLEARRGGPVSLLASSFGVFIAVALIEEMPERIGAVTVSGGILDLRTALVRLGRRIARDRADRALDDACSAAAESEAFGPFWALMGCIGAVPEFWRYYWSPAAVEQRNAMSALAAERGLLDIITYEAVSRSIRRIPRVRELSKLRHRIRVLVGRHDPLAAPEDADAWKRLFPSATVHTVDAGHFPHLELPPSAWMPGSPDCPPARP